MVRPFSLFSCTRMCVYVRHGTFFSHMVCELPKSMIWKFVSLPRMPSNHIAAAAAAPVYLCSFPCVSISLSAPPPPLSLPVCCGFDHRRHRHKTPPKKQTTKTETTEQKGLVPTLTELLQDTSKDPFVLRAARTLIGRVSGREGFGTPGSTTMDVA